MNLYRLKNDTLRMQNELRQLLNDQTIELHEESTITKLLNKFKLRVEFVSKQDILDSAHTDFYKKKISGIVQVPTDHEAGRDFMLGRNVALMALWSLRGKLTNAPKRTIL